MCFIEVLTHLKNLAVTSLKNARKARGCTISISNLKNVETSDFVGRYAGLKRVFNSDEWGWEFQFDLQV